MDPRSEALERNKSVEKDFDDQKNARLGPSGSKLVSEGSRTLKWAIRQLKPMQVWDWLFRSCEVNGRKLVRDGLIEVKDIEECILKGKSNKLGIKLPAWCILQCLLVSAKSDSAGLLLSDEEEVGWVNWPKDKVLEWFLGPLLILKDQIRGLHLTESEEVCLRSLIMTYNNERPEDWNHTGFPSDDNVKRAQLQAILRRLQGMVAYMTRLPSFRRRFNNLVKVLYIEAIENGAPGRADEGNSKPKSNKKRRASKNAKPKASVSISKSTDNNASEAENRIQDNSDNV